MLIQGFSGVSRVLRLATTVIALGAGLATARAELFVVDSSNNAVRMYDQSTGTFLSNFVDNTDLSDVPRQLKFPRHAAFGPDGNLFVAGFDNSALLRYTSLGGNLGIF